MIFRFAAFACLALLAPALGCAAPVRVQIEQYSADTELLSRHYDRAGDSAVALERRRKLLDGWLARVRALDFTNMPFDDQVDGVLLRNAIEDSLDDLADRNKSRQEFAPWLPFRGAVDALADASVHGDPVEPEKAASALAPLGKLISHARDALKAAKVEKSGAQLFEGKLFTIGDFGARISLAVPAPPSALALEVPSPDAPKAAAAGETPTPKPASAIAMPTPYQALRTAELANEVSGSLKRWFENYNGFVPEFGWWVKQPYDDAQKALEEYAKYLREEIAGVKGKDEDPLLGRAIGAESLQRHLDHEFIPYPPQELIALAEREFAWCEDQMKRASGEMGLGDDWKTALKRVKEGYVKPGEQEAFVRTEAKRAIAFVKEHQLITVPADCEEWWGTRMLAPSAQRVMPYVAYGGYDILLAYANESMKQEDKLMAMRGNNRAFTRNVIPHELIPGHHLQKYMAARERPYRRIFETPFFVEGWALYWEMRLWELKYQSTPEDRIGALFWRMHRCARIIVTLKFHLGQMTPNEMVDFLVERVGHEKLGATSEVRRYIGDAGPLYQAGYMLGGLQLLALRKELVVSGRMSEREFHDAILTLGPIPVELIRASLLKLPLNADFKTQWKFDGGQ